MFEFYFQKVFFVFNMQATKHGCSDSWWRVQGKLIEIHFSTMGKICGAKIQTCKTVWVKYVHIKLALFWFLFIFLFFQFNDLTYSYDFVFLMCQFPYANLNSSVRKGNLRCSFWTKVWNWNIYYSSLLKSSCLLWPVKSCSTCLGREVISHILSTLCWIFIWS